MPEGQDGLSEETLKLAAIGRGEEVAEGAVTGAEGGDGAKAAAAAAADEIPEWVPEKFRRDGKPDYEALAKSYAALEKKLSQPKEKADGAADADAGDGADGADGDAGGDAGSNAVASIPAELFSTAEAEWSEAGKLSDATRDKIIASGIPAETLDTYLAGVAALSEALTRSVYETAGGEEDYKAATAWAAKTWTAAQVEKFDNALTDPDLMPAMVKGLMADYRSANPGEGSQTRGGTGGANGGDLYHDAEEFTRDLQEATLKNDNLARKVAVAKLERSKKAGTLKHVTPRTGVSSLL